MNAKIKAVSKMPNSVPLALDTTFLEFCNADYMCIKEPNGELLIPNNYLDFLSSNGGLLEGSIHDLQEKLDLKDLNPQECFWYLSIKKGFVNPQAYQTLNEWHIDGFLRDDWNFIWSDGLPTLIGLGEFSLTPDRYNSLNEYGEQVQEVRASVPYQLYYLDRECVHKPMVNTSDKPIVRTFFKITITKRLFNSKGNAWNYKIPHIKATGGRTNFVNPSEISALWFGNKKD